MGDFWVFGYGSLMWRPGFDVIEAVPATMFGVHRSLCVYSWVHRGTEERPGLVFGLDRGGSCHGMAFRVDINNRQEVLEYLRARELVTNVYLEVDRTARLPGGKKVRTVSYIVDQHHAQYAGVLSPESLVNQIRGATGVSGRNEDYIFNTLSHLRELGIHDYQLEQLVANLG